MNRPPLPTTLSAKRTRRPGQNLECLAPGPSGAVLLPVIPKIPQSQSWILVKRTDVSGEGGKNFILHHFLLEALHPHHRPNRGNQIQLVDRDARKHRKMKDQNGRERPHFFGFQPPKKFLGSLPPSPCRAQPISCRGPDYAVPACLQTRGKADPSPGQSATPKLFSCSCDTNSVQRTELEVRGKSVWRCREAFR
jgi:hypothetical protein